MKIFLFTELESKPLIKERNDLFELMLIVEYEAPNVLYEPLAKPKYRPILQGRS